MSKPKIAESEYENIITLYKSGMKQSDIGNMYGVANNTISRILAKCNIPTNRKVPHSEYKNVEKMYLDGKTLVEIGEYYGVSYKLIEYILNRINTPRRTRSESAQKYSFNEHYFDEIDTPNKAYILGLFASDGCNEETYHRFSIGLKYTDVDILKKIQKEIGSNHPLYYKPPRDNIDILSDGRTIENHSAMYKLQIGNVHASEMLSKYGIVQRKTHTLQFPDWLDKSLLSHYIRGFLDGDGSIGNNNNGYAVRFYGQKCFLEKLQMHLEKTLGIDMKFREHGSIYVLYVYKKQYCQKILNYIYQDADLYLDRKYNVYKSKYV